MGESPVQAAIRELEEELSLKVAPEGISLAFTLSEISDYRPSEIHIFECQLAAKPNLSPDKKEILEAGFFQVDILPNVDLDPLAKKYVLARGCGFTSPPAARAE